MATTEEKQNKIIAQYGDMITGLNDLTAGVEPTPLFWLLANKFSYLLSSIPEVAVPESSFSWRKKANKIIKAIGPNFLPCPQIFENRNYLRTHSETAETDNGIVLPKEPVIWMPNHHFRDDPLATVLAAQRNAYILFGSLPQFFNTFDGITAWLNGVIMINRKVALSRKTSVDKAVRTLRHGTDVIMYPEGILNKSPNVLILPLWSGIYRVACETGAKIVPIIHYIREPSIRDKTNPIHTVIDDPIRIDDMSESAALAYLRDVLATWYYLMMETYGCGSRDELQGNNNTLTEAWEQQLKSRVGTMDRYDKEIELISDYRAGDIIRPEAVWQAIADVKQVTTANAFHVAYASNLVEDLHRQDFQRRF